MRNKQRGGSVSPSVVVDFNIDMTDANGPSENEKHQ